ncbi:hypothetical protein KI809_16100 [Geobacter pelophilus]|uniref:DUF4129 domain-containing protein n=1 Tax=Geoanaerobacter pelophilus TaxID=60036 RepID=A0AAW4L4L3_9BACT|nr:hypothetical protein [Geoanaerobacter pelophilus]MBT0665833.1 hypothetical protein [Geoanaerobacter pelophilus]
MVRHSVVLLAFFSSITGRLYAATTPPEAIRAIHGPIAPTGLPPFALTAATVALCSLAIFLIFRGKPQAVPITSPAEDESEPLAALLATIADQYHQGKIDGAALCDRLTTLLRQHLSRLADAELSHLTSKELLDIAQELLASDAFKQVAELSSFCDSVRFGAVQPQDEQSLRAISITAQLLQPGTGARA